MTVQIRLEGSAGNLTLTEDDIVRINPVKTHSGLGDFTATIAGNRNVEEFAARQDKILFDFNGSTEFVGYLTNVEHTLSSGDTRLSGKGIAKRLQETRPDYDSLGGPLTYSNIAVEDAIRDYWSRTEFSNYTVYDQPIETVATDELIQNPDTTAEWESVTTEEPTQPWIVENDSLTLNQVCFTVEGENADSITGATNDPGDPYSDGVAIVLEETGDAVEYNITPEYDIPAGELNVQIRLGDGSDGTLSEGLAGFEVRFEGEPLDQTGVIANLFLDWYDVGTGFFDSSIDWNPPALNAGETYTLEIECTDGGDLSDQVAIDVISVYDSRFESSLTFDNSVNTPGGYLDGPQLYPDVVDIATDIFGASFNITASDLTATINDTGNTQAIAVSNNGGTDYTSFANTSTLSHTYVTNGREARVRFSLGQTTDVRDTATPRTGYLAQTVDSFDHRVDGNNLAVIVDLELSKSHFDNLQTLHEKGDYQFTIEHDDAAIADLVVESFRRGEQTRTLPLDNEIESTPAIAAGNYFNSIYLQGQLVSGDRPVAEITDSDRASQDGREISPGVLRDLDISTEAGAAYRARTLLERAKTNNALRGQKTYPADFSLQVGYAYNVDFGEGETELTAEEISLSLGSNQATVTLDFVPPTDLSEDISELRRQARQLEDRV